MKRDKNIKVTSEIHYRLKTEAAKRATDLGRFTDEVICRGLDILKVKNYPPKHHAAAFSTSAKTN